MTLPGYDPDDVDRALEARLSERDLREFLTEAERREWEAGASITDLLDEGDLKRLFDRIEEA